MNKFFEPWSAHKGVLSNIKHHDGVPNASDIRMFGCFDTAIYPADYAELQEELGDGCPDDLDYALAERAASCVNAMQGVDYPEMWVAQILEDLQNAISWIDDGDDNDGKSLIVGPMRAKYNL